jgi:hypothetical protein
MNRNIVVPVAASVTSRTFEVAVGGYLNPPVRVIVFGKRQAVKRRDFGKR